MVHRVAPYRVWLHAPNDADHRLTFTNYDGTGRWIGDAIETALSEFVLEPDPTDVTDRDQNRIDLEQITSVVAGRMIGATYIGRHRSGRFRINDEHGGHVHDTNDTDTMSLRFGVLFGLPAGATSGHMLVHVRDNRSIKTGLATHLRRRVRELTGLIIEIEASADQNVLLAAVQQQGIQKVRLVKYSPTKTDAFEDAIGAYGGDEEVGTLEVSISARRARHLFGTNIERFLTDRDPESWRNMIVFRGLEFDDVKVVVPHPVTGRPKNYSLRAPEGGHPVQLDLTIDDDDAFGVSAAVLMGALIEELEDHGP